MKKVIIILTLFTLFINTAYSAVKFENKEVSVPSDDGFNIKAKFTYPKIKGQKEYNTVILLHSLGYSSEWWETLPDLLLNNGYAVLNIDLRGHGKSIYNKKLSKISWKNMKQATFLKYPDDVVNVVNYVKKENSKKAFFDNWAVVGADIGANTAILAADRMETKPKTIVLLSPSIQTKGLYVPVKLAGLDVDILSISGQNEHSAFEAEKYLQRFAQKTFATYTAETNSTGMLMLKNDETLAKIIVSWIREYL